MAATTRIILSSTLAFAALTCATAGVTAQTIYRAVDEAGRVTFTDRPTQTASNRRTRPENVAWHVARALATRTAISSRGSAIINANEATGRLAQAREMRDRGTQPLYGERANGPGPRKVNARYWQRQERLQLAVDAALRRSDETSRALRAYR